MQYKFERVLTNTAGDVHTGITVNVYEAGGSTPADVYAASTGGSPVNSVDSDGTTGVVIFWVDEADYGSDQLFKITYNPGAGLVSEDDIQIFGGLHETEIDAKDAAVLRQAILAFGFYS